MAALYESLRVFQAAHDKPAGQLLNEVLARDPNQVCQGLLTVLPRPVFIFFAEDRGSSPPTPSTPTITASADSSRSSTLYMTAAATDPSSICTLAAATSSIPAATLSSKAATPPTTPSPFPQKEAAK